MLSKWRNGIDKYITLKLITVSRHTPKIIHYCIPQVLNIKLHENHTLVEAEAIMEVQEVCFRVTYFHLRMGRDPAPETICSFQMCLHK
jgi:hypothetical protein